jgi:hypothetical protein
MMVLAAAACAAEPGANTASAPSVPPSPTPPAQAAPAAVPQVSDGAPPQVPPAPTPRAGKGRRRPCAELREAHEATIDATRRRLYETLCSATLWLDGLFGDYGSVRSAEKAAGRLQVYGLGSKFEGTKVRTSVDVDVDVPHLQHRLRAFFGREDPRDYVRDRREGLGLHSQFLDLERNEKWLAGLGYSLPGSFVERTDFRFGGSAGHQPAVFGQAILQKNVSVGEFNLWRLRETVFWHSREGFGATTNVDRDHLIGSNMLLRWGNVATVSEEFHGLDWRTAVVLYHHLGHSRALAYETFVRGRPSTGVLLGEYGARVVYRQSFYRRWLFGDALVGYSWRRDLEALPRVGSTTIGLGTELVFGKGY